MICTDFEPNLARPQAAMRQQEENCVKFTALHFAMRELHAVVRIPTPWICGTGVGVILALLAPFDTENTLPLWARLIYWVCLACLSFFTGAFLNDLLRSLTRPFPKLPHPAGFAAVVLVGVVISAAVLAEVLLMNWLVFGLPPRRMDYSLPIAINTLAISIVVNGVITWVTERLPPEDASQRETAPEEETVPVLIERLSFEKRGRLISLSVQDHYVEVTTTKGREMLLMRLRDAMREAGAGFQIHRSHWVAEGAIHAVQRKSSAAEVTTTDGRTLPVSRSYLPVLKEKGLLSR